MSRDAELLRRYAAEHSEAAFAELVRLHVNLVYFAALRQVGGDAHRAQDITQTVFTDLARKAAALASRATLTGWLHTSTRFAAAKARRAAATRQKLEQEAEIMQTLLHDSNRAAEWERLRPMIDDAIHELNDRDREAVLLRFFEGQPFAEIGATLHVSEDGARMRVERALDKLRTALARRGVSSSTAALAVAFADQAGATTPAGLVASVTGAALSGVAASGPGIVATVIAFMTATKTTVTLGVVAALTIATAFYQSNQARAATASLAAARKDHAALRTRLGDLEKQAQTTEDLSSSSRPAPTAARPVPAVSAAEAAKAKSDLALQHLLETDPQLRQLEVEADRLSWITEWGPFMKNVLGLTPAQLQQAVGIHDQWRASKYAQRDLGLPPKDTDDDEFDLKFGVAFGNAACARFYEVAERYDSIELVNELSAKLFYADTPFTAPQAEQLAKIIADAGPKPRPRRTADWERVIREAEPILSPAQLQGLRGMAASARMTEQLSAVKAAANSPTK